MYPRTITSSTSEFIFGHIFCKIIVVLMGSENKLLSRCAEKHLKQCQTDLRFTSSRPPDWQKFHSKRILLLGNRSYDLLSNSWLTLYKQFLFTQQSSMWLFLFYAQLAWVVCLFTSRIHIPRSSKITFPSEALVSLDKRPAITKLYVSQRFTSTGFFFL